ncbi:AAA family ATPase (plasmid) [Rhizobium sp. CB3171]|uniref:ATP-dependent nuclease n=1 Tax=Rhizobium sp. CB3171 TaxID=3039157 RepID=UPI0024B09D18|nr:AAA family ATPase [Rhizobium sp. CB3171]WFU07371.1 AAA family ATPase [Rhizobium sp. CB3171]
MGIRVDEVKALLDVRGVSLSGGAISLHDQDQIPMKNLGSGSTRLLVAGLQKAVGRSSIFIVDELEYGLEPYRIVRLLDSLGAKRNDTSQQVFLTTHSPIVLRELSSAQLFAVRALSQKIPPVINAGITVQPARKVTRNWVTHLGNEEAAQKTLRACAEAFLAPSVIVCEGKTEIGILRGIDLNFQERGQRSILSYGSHWADGGGSTMMERAKIFALMGYRTALFMDSDVPYAPQVYTDLLAAGVTVYRWAEGYSTESALFASAPAALIPALLAIACDWRGEDSVNARISAVSGGNLTLALCWGSFTEEMRPVLGRAAGDGKWFKDIEPAERAMREVVAQQMLSCNPLFRTPIELLWHWVMNVPAETAS